jgi:hypothetical protein
MALGLFAEWQPRFADVAVPSFPVVGKKPAIKGYLKVGMAGVATLRPSSVRGRLRDPAEPFKDYRAGRRHPRRAGARRRHVAVPALAHHRPQRLGQLAGLMSQWRRGAAHPRVPRR